jgi:hypothetical protein
MLTEVHAQQSAYRNLAVRNTKTEQMVPVDPTARVLLPFLLVRTKAQCVINCEVDETHTEYFLNFTMPFEIQDDHSVLAQLGLSTGVVLPTLEEYATQVLAEAMAQTPAPPAAAASAPASTVAPAVAVALPATLPTALSPAVFAPPVAPLPAAAEPKSPAKK